MSEPNNLSHYITRDKIQSVELVSCWIKNSTFICVILCWMIALSPIPTLGDDGSAPTPFTIPNIRVDYVEYRGGIVIPSFLLVEDPEIDVTPSPTASKQPTRLPTRNPTVTTPAPVPPPTNAPIIPPTSAPIVTTANPTTPAPVIISTATPTSSPIISTSAPIAPTTMEPSVYPSLQPIVVTDQPSMVMSVEPSFPPSAAPITVTLAPITNLPSSSPSLQPTEIAPPPRQFVNVTVPLGFNVDVMIQRENMDDGDHEMTAALMRMEEIWENALLEYYTNAFSGREAIRPTSVDLTVSQQQQRRRRSVGISTHQHHRAAQQTNGETITIQATGDASFAVDELSVDTDGFVTRAEEQLPLALTANRLQEAIDDAGASDIVTVVSEISTIPTPVEPELDTDDGTTDEKSPSTNRQPSKAEIVLGFTLLVLTIASLVFWSHVLWQKRKKRLRQRRLESLRKMQSLTYQSSLDQSLPPIGSNNIEAPTVHNRSAVDLPPESGIPKAETYEGTSGDEDRMSDESDPFARELQKAASFDRAAWEAFERNKTPQKGNGDSVANSDVGIARMSNVSVYDTNGGDIRDIGVEVQPRNVGSFPYGDENQNRSTPPVRLSNKNAVPWTIAGISLAPFAQRQNKNETKDQATAQFSPYGDKGGRSLQESWDLDEFPVKDENGPSQFSFLYPLRRQDLNSDIPDARRSPDSEVSVRDESLEVTSVGTPDYTNTQNIREAQLDEADKDDESDNASQSAITASMLKELDDIANFVKQYEELKKSRSSVLQQSRGSLLHSTNNRQPESNGPMMPSKYSVQTAATGHANPNFVKSRSNDTSLGLSDEEDDDETASILSQRLGISRISVERPGAAPMLSYKNSQDDPLQWEMDTADLSPFPSSDIDSLRYSPSQSFEKQQGAINFAKESLLDGIPQYQGTMSEDLEDVDVPYAISTNDNTTATAPAGYGDPSKANDMLGYLRKTISDRRSGLEPPPQHNDEGIEAVEARISPRVRSKDQKYNTIRSMFESKRTAPIIPPNESVRLISVIF